MNNRDRYSQEELIAFSQKAINKEKIIKNTEKDVEANFETYKTSYFSNQPDVTIADIVKIGCQKEYAYQAETNKRILFYLQSFTDSVYIETISTLNQFLHAKILFIKGNNFEIDDILNIINTQIITENEDILKTKIDIKQYENDEKLFEKFEKIIEEETFLERSKQLEELNRKNKILEKCIAENFINRNWENFLLTHAYINKYEKEDFFKNFYAYFFISMIEAYQPVSNKDLKDIENYIELRMRLIYINYYRLFFDDNLKEIYTPNLDKECKIKNKNLSEELIAELKKVNEAIENECKYGKISDEFYNETIKQIDSIEKRLPQQKEVEINPIRSIKFINPKEDIPRYEDDEFIKKTLFGKSVEETKVEGVDFTPANQEEIKKCKLLNAFFEKNYIGYLVEEEKKITNEFLKLSLASLTEELASQKSKIKTAEKICLFYPKIMPRLQKMKSDIEKIHEEYVKEKKEGMDVNILSSFFSAVQETQFDMNVLNKSVEDVIWDRFVENFKGNYPKLAHPLVILSGKMEKKSGFLERFSKPKKDDTVLIAIQTAMGQDFIAQKASDLGLELGNPKLNTPKSFSLF